MRRLPFRVGGLSAAVLLALVAAGCGMAVPSKSGADSVKVASKRDDREMQVTSRGHPLYYYSADASTPGKTRGEDVQRFGAGWYLVGQNGKSVEPNDSNSNSTGGGY